MKIKGTKTEVKQVDIEVDPHEVIGAALKLFDKKYPPRGDHIRDGVWQVYWFTDGHNGDDNYKDGEKATKREKELQKIRRMIEWLPREDEPEKL